MEGRPTPRAELTAAVRSLRELLRGDREIGLDPPPVDPSAMSFQAPPAATGPKDETAGAQTLEQLREILGDCRRCGLHEGRNHIVFGEGDAHADLVFVAEGPGREEDRIGRPFVGEAGRLLTRIIEAMGLRREQVYICNVVKCRPPRNRDPREDEVAACIPFLRRQLELIAPRVICILGRVAGQALLGPDFSITREHGKWLEYRGVPVMPVFHPAYLLRNSAARRPVWDDVQKIMKVLGLGGDSHA